MRYVLSPWGRISSAAFSCDKCGTPMHEEHDRKSGTKIYACFKCGNRLYSDYPKHRGCNFVTFDKGEDLAA